MLGKSVTVLGVAFKPNSDDIRDSPSLDVCERLSQEGAVVTAHDPVAMANAARVKPGLRYASSVPEAASGADLLLHLTEWPDYRALDPAALAAVVARPVMRAVGTIEVHQARAFLRSILRREGHQAIDATSRMAKFASVPSVARPVTCTGPKPKWQSR